MKVVTEIKKLVNNKDFEQLEDGDTMVVLEDGSKIFPQGPIELEYEWEDESFHHAHGIEWVGSWYVTRAKCRIQKLIDENGCEVCFLAEDLREVSREIEEVFSALEVEEY